MDDVIDSAFEPSPAVVKAMAAFYSGRELLRLNAEARAEIERLRQEIERLREFEWMYKELCK